MGIEIIPENMASITINYTETSNQSSISDLTGTSWKINSLTSTAGYGQFSVYAYSDSDPEFEGIYMGIGYYYSPISGWRTQADFVCIADPDDPTVYVSISVNDTITITGGADATSSGSGFASLVSWLEANATQQSTVSLVNTKWRFKDNPDLSSFPAAGTSYSINFVSNATDYTSLKLATTSITYNTTVVYTGTTALTAPSVALSSDIVTITDNDGNATGFKVYWDGSTTVAETITKTS